MGRLKAAATSGPAVLEATWPSPARQPGLAAREGSRAALRLLLLPGVGEGLAEREKPKRNPLKAPRAPSGWHWWHFLTQPVLSQLELRLPKGVFGRWCLLFAINSGRLTHLLQMS